MELLALVLHAVLELPFKLLDLLPPWLSLTLVSVASGAAILWVVGKLTDQRRLERARDRMGAHIYEMRIYLDSPVRILKAQVAFIRSSLEYIGVTLPSLLVVAAPLGLLLLHLEPRFDRSPISVGQDAVMMVRLSEPPVRANFSVKAGPGVRLTAAPLFAGDRVYLRVRPEEPGVHQIEVKTPEQTVVKTIASGGRGPASPERTTGLNALFGHGIEPPLPSSGKLREIRLFHPVSGYHLLGLPWWLYFLLVATGAAMLLRGPMKVAL